MDPYNGPYSVSESDSCVPVLRPLVTTIYYNPYITPLYTLVCYSSFHFLLHYPNVAKGALSWFRGREDLRRSNELLRAMWQVAGSQGTTPLFRVGSASAYPSCALPSSPNCCATPRGGKEPCFPKLGLGSGISTASEKVCDKNTSHQGWQGF